MNIKEFIGKYKIIVFLVAMIIVLAFIKSYFGNKVDNSENNNKSTITITPTNGVSNTKNGLNENNSNEENNLQSNDSKEIDEQNNLSNDGVVVNSSETDKKRNQLIEKGRTYETEKEYEAWFETLSFEDQELLKGDKIIQISQLNDELPYESDTFVIKNIISNSVIQVKSKIDDLEKAEVDVRKWLSSKAMDFDNLSISWE